MLFYFNSPSISCEGTHTHTTFEVFVTFLTPDVAWLGFLSHPVVCVITDGSVLAAAADAHRR